MVSNIGIISNLKNLDLLTYKSIRDINFFVKLSINKLQLPKIAISVFE